MTTRVPIYIDAEQARSIAWNTTYDLLTELVERGALPPTVKALLDVMGERETAERELARRSEARDGQ